jgi:hypothetical protein
MVGVDIKVAIERNLGDDEQSSVQRYLILHLMARKPSSPGVCALSHSRLSALTKVSLVVSRQSSFDLHLQYQ